MNNEEIRKRANPNYKSNPIVMKNLMVSILFFIAEFPLRFNSIQFLQAIIHAANGQILKSTQELKTILNNEDYNFVIFPTTVITELTKTYLNNLTFVFLR